MKFKITYILSVLLLAAFFMHAQQQKGESFISLGTGISKIGLKYTDHTLLLNGSYDYGLKKNFSLGLAVTHLGFTHFTSMENTNANETKNTIHTQVNATLLNIGLRPLYHFSKRRDLDIYAGARLGSTLLKECFDKEGVSMSRQRLTPSAQFVGGIRWFLDYNFGVNMELATGGPYFLSLGVHYKI